MKASHSSDSIPTSFTMPGKRTQLALLDRFIWSQVPPTWRLPYGFPYSIIFYIGMESSYSPISSSWISYPLLKVSFRQGLPKLFLLRAIYFFVRNHWLSRCILRARAKGMKPKFTFCWIPGKYLQLGLMALQTLAKEALEELAYSVWWLDFMAESCRESKGWSLEEGRYLRSSATVSLWHSLR